MAKHQILKVRAKIKPYDHLYPSELDRALSQLTSSGEKILDFWRAPWGWVFKVMAR